MRVNYSEKILQHNRHQASPSIYCIGIWHARYSRLTQRQTLTIQFGAQACQPGNRQLDTCPNNQLQTFCKVSAKFCMMSIMIMMFTVYYIIDFIYFGCPVFLVHHIIDQQFAQLLQVRRFTVSPQKGGGGHFSMRFSQIASESMVTKGSAIETTVDCFLIQPYHYFSSILNDTATHTFQRIIIQELISRQYALFLIASMQCVSDLKNDFVVLVVVLGAELLSKFPQN